eukprot:7013295-Prymnesium_polylepis.1
MNSSGLSGLALPDVRRRWRWGLVSRRNTARPNTRSTMWSGCTAFPHASITDVQRPCSPPIRRA